MSWSSIIQQSKVPVTIGSCKNSWICQSELFMDSLCNTKWFMLFMFMWEFPHSFMLFPIFKCNWRIDLITIRGKSKQKEHSHPHTHTHTLPLSAWLRALVWPVLCPKTFLVGQVPLSPFCPMSRKVFEPVTTHNLPALWSCWVPYLPSETSPSGILERGVLASIVDRMGAKCQS